MSSDGDPNDLQDFRSLHRFFVFVATTKMGKAQDEADSVARQWVKCWQVGIVIT